MHKEFGVILSGTEWIVMEATDHCPMRLRCKKCGGFIDIRGVGDSGIPFSAISYLARGFQEIHIICGGNNKNNNNNDKQNRRWYE